jgi:hypothetical protein
MAVENVTSSGGRPEQDVQAIFYGLPNLAANSHCKAKPAYFLQLSDHDVGLCTKSATTPG